MIWERVHFQVLILSESHVYEVISVKSGDITTINAWDIFLVFELLWIVKTLRENRKSRVEDLHCEKNEKKNEAASSRWRFVSSILPDYICWVFGHPNQEFVFHPVELLDCQEGLTSLWVFKRAIERVWCSQLVEFFGDKVVHLGFILQDLFWLCISKLLSSRAQILVHFFIKEWETDVDDSSQLLAQACLIVKSRADMLCQGSLKGMDVITNSIIWEIVIEFSRECALNAVVFDSDQLKAHQFVINQSFGLHEKKKEVESEAHENSNASIQKTKSLFATLLAFARLAGNLGESVLTVSLLSCWYLESIVADKGFTILLSFTLIHQLSLKICLVKVFHVFKRTCFNWFWVIIATPKNVNKPNIVVVQLRWLWIWDNTGAKNFRYFCVTLTLENHRNGIARVAPVERDFAAEIRREAYPSKRPPGAHRKTLNFTDGVEWPKDYHLDASHHRESQEEHSKPIDEIEETVSGWTIQKKWRLLKVSSSILLSLSLRILKKAR